jgi:mRNA interferase MazF
VVVTADLINNRPGGLIGIVPITSARYGLRSHVELEKGPSGLSYESFARCDQIRMLSIQRLKSQRGHVPIQAMDEIDRALRFILGL